MLVLCFSKLLLLKPGGEMSESQNFYQNQGNAQAYSHRNYQETYYLIERCLDVYFNDHWPMQSRCHANVVDFGCGTGSSSRLLRDFGFSHILGLDPSASMIEAAKELDVMGDYRQLSTNFDWQDVKSRFDLVSSSFVLPVLSTEKDVYDYLHQGRQMMKENGTFLIVTAGKEAFDPKNSWLSWHQDFPENSYLYNGGPVKGFLKKAELLLCDTLWTQEFLYQAFEDNHLSVETLLQPLGKALDPYPWLSELSVSPFEIYILKNS